MVSLPCQKARLIRFVCYLKSFLLQFVSCNQFVSLTPFFRMVPCFKAFKATFAEELKELSASPFGSTLVGKFVASGIFTFDVVYRYFGKTKR